jgi:pyrroline-5-carboxylate reductase
MVAQLMIGTGKLLQEKNTSPSQLLERVTTPAGTTIEGVRLLEQHGVRSAMMEALLAANQKSKTF